MVATTRPSRKGRISHLTERDRQRLAAATIVHRERLSIDCPRREFLTALAAGLLPSAWLTAQPTDRET